MTDVLAVNWPDTNYLAAPAQPAFAEAATLAAVPRSTDNTPTEASSHRQELLTAEQEVVLATRIEAGLYAEMVLFICSKTAEERAALRVDMTDSLAREIVTARHNSTHDPVVWQESIATATAKTDELMEAACSHGTPDERGVIVMPDDHAGDMTWIVEDGKHAWQDFWMANRGMVGYAARAKQGRGVRWHDLVEAVECNGLVRALGKFDYAKGYKFSTYAMWWLRQAATRAVESHNHTIAEAASIHAVTDALWMELGRRPEAHEVANELQIDVAKIEQAWASGVRMISLYARCHETDESAELQDVLPSDAPEAQVEAVVDRAVLAGLLGPLIDACLLPGEAAVVRLRFGIGLPRGEGLVFEEIGERLGYDRKCVAANFGKAIDILRYVAGFESPDYFRTKAMPKARQCQLRRLRQTHGPQAQALMDFWAAN